ncbi:MAG: ankyrin repeat domain-containing protein [Gemmatimonadetes bacterium]|nr:ankyrin repeat domain-containing protein [Gemmatimonadota bacterium]
MSVANRVTRLGAAFAAAALLAGARPAAPLHVPASAPPPTRQPTSVSSTVANAAQRRDAAAVRALVSKGADVNEAQGDGMTALHWAARNGDTELTAFLLKSKARHSATTRIGALTPLHLAAENGHAQVVAALLKGGADFATPNSTGVTALHLASLSGNADAVRQLLERGANANVMEPAWGHTPLMFAAARGRTEAVRVLLARGANAAATAKVVDLVALEAQDRVTRQRRNEVLGQLRKAQGADTVVGWHPDAQQVQQAVRAALTLERASTGDVASAAADSAEDTARAAVAAGNAGDTDPPGYTALVGVQGGLTALMLAIRDGHTETVRALLDGGANIDQASAADSTTPLLLATINGHYDIAKMLVARNADPNLASNAGATPLYAVINKEWAPTSRTPQPTFNLQQQTSYMELMEALLAAKADPNARLKSSLWYTTYNRDNLRVDFNGATPFWRAAYATDIPAMKLLLARGADPKIATIREPVRARGGRGGRGSDGAAGSGTVGPDGGADVPVRLDPSGLPPIQAGGPGIPAIVAAAGVGYGQGFAANDHRHAPDSWVSAVRFLVEELGADVNARDPNGFTALHFAAARGDNDLINYLVSKGADVKAVARSGQTTADMANGPVQRISPYLETVALLERLGSKNSHKCVSC